MDARILQFISALRASGVQISIAESIDAFKAVELLGVKDRERFRLALFATTIKNSNQVTIFEELFPLFFESPYSPASIEPLQGLSDQELDLLSQALNSIEDELGSWIRNQRCAVISSTAMSHSN